MTKTADLEAQRTVGYHIVQNQWDRPGWENAESHLEGEAS